MGSLVTVRAGLTADVPVNGTFTIPYPSGYTQASLTGSLGCMVSLDSNDQFYQNSGSVAFSFGASLITIQNLSPITWPAGSYLRIGIGVTNRRGSNYLTLGTEPSQAAPGNAAPAVPGQFNFSANGTQFTKWKAGVARVKGNTGRARIVCLGDSTTWGEGGGDSGGNLRNNAKERCWPTMLAKRLSTLGAPANYENAYASGSNVGIVAVSDWNNFYKAGFTVSGAWAFSSSTTAGGCLWVNASDTVGVISITSQMPVDTFELVDINSATASAIITYNIDGGAETQLIQSGANSLRKTVIPCGSVGVHTLNIKRISGANTFYLGYRAWNSTVNQIDVLNVGRGSSQTSDWVVAANPWSALNFVTDVCANADLVTIDFTINDALLGQTVAQYKTNLNTIINQAKAGGASILLMTGNPSNTATIPDATQQAFRQGMKDVAIAGGYPMIDQYDKYTDWATLNALGWMYNNNHPNKLGYADLGAFVGDTVNTYGA